MSFTSVSFLNIFLPLTIILYFLVGFENKVKYKNFILTIASILFYAWCGIQYLILFIVIILINYLCARKLSYAKNKKRRLCLVITLDVVVLTIFKYFNFFVDNIEKIGQSVYNRDFAINEPLIPLPLGISFIVFQMIAFMVDVYKDEVKVDSVWDVVLFFMFFPQVVQGPILRYNDISSELKTRISTKENLCLGAERFIIGFVKKILVADKLVPLSNYIFSTVDFGVAIGYAWLGVICYAFVIYFDFSGYTDMAIGIAKIFGFDIPENFEHPYIAQSIQEFWQRWHITLSRWFKDYVYIPLGGNRKGKLASGRNIMIVFLLTGIWHGASWTFVIWGVWHGIFRIIEMIGLKKILQKIPVIFRYIYTWLIVLVGWVFFRADNIKHALLYIKSMFLPNDATYLHLGVLKYFDLQLVVVMLIAILFSMPIRKKIVSFISDKKLFVFYRILLCVLFFLAMASMLGSSVNPSIYEKF
ncbi:MAG: MBOAT family protein [Lachnospiraceae bacterium]|nr:MBOAT family protein [Lachnospiraceae bacterium]